MVKKRDLYPQQVLPFINSNYELDETISSLWMTSRKKGSEIDMTTAKEFFIHAVEISPNIGRKEPFTNHCLTVSDISGRVAQKILENYDFLGDVIDPIVWAFAGLIEDSMYLVGGNPYSKNGWKGEDSNPIHEILTLYQMDHLNNLNPNMGFDIQRDGMSMHFTAPQILTVLQAEGRFMDAPYLEREYRNLMLDALTAVDAIVKGDGEFLPDKYDGEWMPALEERVEDVISRRRENNPNHLLIRGYDLNKPEKQGEGDGQRRLELVVRTTEGMYKGTNEKELIRNVYALQE